MLENVPSPKLSKDVADLVDDALAKVCDLGTVGAMKWLAKAMDDRAATKDAVTGARTIELPEGYQAVLVPEGVAPPEPDYDACARQADLATGAQCKDRNWLNIFIREINRWCAHRQADTNEAMQATVKHAFRSETDDVGQITRRCRFCGTAESSTEGAAPCRAVSLLICTSRSYEVQLKRKRQQTDDRVERAHTLLLDLLKQAGISDGSRGWIQHDDHRRGLVKDALSFEAELLFGFEAIIEELNTLRANAGTPADTQKQEGAADA
jgi:hypothetical protein